MHVGPWERYNALLGDPSVTLFWVGASFQLPVSKTRQKRELCRHCVAPRTTFRPSYDALFLRGGYRICGAKLISSATCYDVVCGVELLGIFGTGVRLNESEVSFSVRLLMREADFTRCKLSAPLSQVLVGRGVRVVLSHCFGLYSGALSAGLGECRRFNVKHSPAGNCQLAPAWITKSSDVSVHYGLPFQY